MRRWLPILALIAGLGSFISCKRAPDAQAKPAVELPKPSAPAPKSPQPETVPTPAETSAANEVDPFTRYLTVENAHGHFDERPVPGWSYVMQRKRVDQRSARGSSTAEEAPKPVIISNGSPAPRSSKK